MNNELSIEQVSYQNVKHVRILQACLEKWFQNPKDLQLTSPKVPYPFKFKKWIDVSYRLAESITYIIKKEDWIVGHLSIQLRPQFNSIHIFHVFIDRSHRKKGYSKLLIEKALDYAKQHNIKKITLAVNKNNQIAIDLYKFYKFEIIGENEIGSLKMILTMD